MVINSNNKAYKYAVISTKIKLLIDLLRTKSQVWASSLWSEITALIMELCTEYAVEKPESCQRLWSAAEEVAKKCSGVADASFQGLLETILLPAFYSFEFYDSFFQDTFGDWSVYPSLSGFMTLCDANNVFFHGTVDPLYDEYVLAKSIYNPSQPSFHIFGGGLGYLASALSDISEGSLDIYIYEHNKYVMNAFDVYGVIPLEGTENIHIIRNENFEELLETFLTELEKEGSACPCYYINPLISGYAPSEYRVVVTDLIANALTQSTQSFINHRNAVLNFKNIKQFLPSFSKKSECIVVAGGPSVDSNIAYLKSVNEQKTIIAVSTIYKRLLNEGIRPDYVCVMDPQERTYGHVDGVDTKSSTLIAGIEAAWQFGRNWEGPKFLFPACCDSYSFDRLQGLGIQPVNAGGTVSSMAIEVCVYLGADTIELIGIDLSFPDNKSHATGTMDFQICEENSVHYVPYESVNGETVNTTLQFLGYAKVIEDQISSHSKVHFYNLSDCGIIIKGCIERNHSEA